MTDSQMHRRAAKDLARLRSQHEEMAVAVWRECRQNNSNAIVAGDVFRVELGEYIGPYFRALASSEVERAE